MLALMKSDENICITSLILYEWRRGPRTEAELHHQAFLFPEERVLTFGSEEARIAADLYRAIRRPRNREVDIAIAATAIHNKAELWTLNRADFADIPGLRLI